jgi:hypothetical protein
MVLKSPNLWNQHQSKSPESNTAVLWLAQLRRASHGSGDDPFDPTGWGNRGNPLGKTLKIYPIKGVLNHVKPWLNPFSRFFLGVRTWVEGKFTSLSCWPWIDPLKKECFKKEKHGENTTKLECFELKFTHSLHPLQPGLEPRHLRRLPMLRSSTGGLHSYPTQLRYVLFTNGCKRGYHSTNIHGVILYIYYLPIQSESMSWSRVVLY